MKGKPRIRVYINSVTSALGRSNEVDKGILFQRWKASITTEPGEWHLACTLKKSPCSQDRPPPHSNSTKLLE